MAAGMTAAHTALMEARGPCALLESSSGPGPLAEQTLLFRNPLAWCLASRDGLRVFDAHGERRVAGEPFALLRAWLRQLAPGSGHEGAVVGALSYDWARPARALRHDPMLVALLVARVESFAPEPASASARSGAPGTSLELAVHSNLSREAYCALVRRAQAHIAAGDIYQANLSQRFELDCTAGGLALYRELRRASPAPFSGYLRVPGLEIVSASPERLVSVRSGEICTRPIAGTRPRSADPERDAALARELMLSEKERAEHLMLVDLARNDLGQVAQIGSVRVDELMAVEHYAQVRHIVSNVRARLARGRDALDALQALFPGGTITGVPKRRCLELLDELEPVARGFYTGALFYATPGGNLDSNILIRSAVVAGGRVRFHTGAGIVADSDPDQEYDETLHKAAGMRLALERLLAP